MGFKENLKNELTYQGILVKELSQKTGIPKRSLDNYLREKGSMPPADYAVKIAKALNTSVEYLVEGKNENFSDINTHRFCILYNKLNAQEKEFFLRLLEGFNKVNN